MQFAILAFLTVLLALPLNAQHHQTPYTGMQHRSIKALSDQKVADLKAGRGIGLALAGELNGYPGPLHVLELSESLALTFDQKKRVQHLFEEMKSEAIEIGEQLIELESALNREFAEQRITYASLPILTTQIAEAEGKLRATHLKYHITTAEILTAPQRHRYKELRGYH